MSRSVTWNGMTQFRAGGLTRINASALAQIGLAPNGIIGLIGEADGGTAEPGEIVTIDDPALSKEYFRSGTLADAVIPAFDPSVDPRMPGGAFRVLGIRTNTATQASRTLYGRYTTDTTAAGCTTTVINVTTGGLTVDALINDVLRVNGEDRTITDNDATSITVGTAFSSAPASGVAVEVLAPMYDVTTKQYGTPANDTTFEWEPGVTAGGAWTNSFEGTDQIGEDIGDSSFLQVEYVGQSTTVENLIGTATGGTTTTLVVTAAGWAINAWQDMYLEVTLGGIKNIRKIASNTADTITVTGTMTGSPTTETFRVLVGAILDGDVAAAAAGTVTLESTVNVAANELDGLVVAIVANAVGGGTGLGQVRTVTSHTTGVSAVLTLDDNWTTTPDTTSDYQVRYVEAATGSFVGALGVASSFQTSVTINGAAAATDLNITIDSKMTVADLANTINADSNYTATIPATVNTQTTMANTFDFDLGNTAVEIRTDKATITTQPSNSPTYGYTETWKNNFKRNVAVIVADINDKAEFITATRSTSGGAGTGSGAPEWSGGSIGTAGDTVLQLSGGGRGTSDNAAFQSAFDKLILERHNFVIPLIVQDLSEEGLSSTATWASVAAQLSAHVSEANGIAKNECGGLIGFKGTKTEYITAANTYANTDIQMTSQRLQVLDVDGSLATQDEWSLAVVAAGMRSGAPEVGEPITHKYLKAYALEQDTSWDPRDRTDANNLIANGCLFAEHIEGKGIRFVRDLTTYVQDDNLAYSEGSTRDVVRYVAYGLRTTLEDRYTGVKAKPANAAGIKATAVAYLESLNAENIIVTSLNEDNVVVPGFEKLRVSISGDIATVRVQVYPAVGINFQLNDIYLQLPRLTA